MNERKKKSRSLENVRRDTAIVKSLKQFNYDAFLGSTAAMLPAEMSFQRAIHIETRENGGKKYVDFVR